MSFRGLSLKKSFSVLYYSYVKYKVAYITYSKAPNKPTLTKSKTVKW